MGNDYNSKRDLVDSLKSSLWETVQQLLGLCDDEDADVRNEAFEALTDLRSQEISECVHRHLDDSDEIVRTTCLENIGSWTDTIAEGKIVSMLTDESELVRMAAIVTIGELKIHSGEFLLNNILGHCDDEEKLRVYFALYKLGSPNYFPLFLNGLHHDFYRIRCTTANMIPRVATPNNKALLLDCLTERLAIEDTAAARSSIESTIAWLREME